MLFFNTLLSLEETPVTTPFRKFLHAGLFRQGHTGSARPPPPHPALRPDGADPGHLPAATGRGKSGFPRDAALLRRADSAPGRYEMKRSAIVLGILLAFVALSVVLVPRLVTIENWKPEIVARVKDITGRDLRISGPMHLSVFPRIELVLADVALSNAAGAEPAEMMTLEELRLDLALRPLFSGDLEVESFVLERPSISLAIDERGNRNWTLAPSSSASPAAKRPAGASSWRELHVKEARIVDGRIAWTDRRSGASYEFAGVNLALSLPGIDQPLDAKGDFTWRGETVDIAISVSDPRELAESGRSALSATIDAPSLRLRLDEAQASPSPPQIDGNLTLDVRSVREVAAWLGAPTSGPGATLRALTVRGLVALSAAELAIHDAEVTLDETHVTGDLRVQVALERPKIEGSLACERLDLDPYLAPGPPAAATTGAPGDAWSDDPIAFDRLKVLDASLDLALGEIEASDLRIGRTKARVVLTAGNLAVDLPEVALYAGTGKASLRVDASGTGPAATDLSLDLSGLRADAALHDLVGFDRLSGTGQLQGSIGTRGRSTREMVGALRGTTRLDLRDGTIRGINLVGMVTHVTDAFERSDAAKTDFSSLASSFRIDRGIARTDDLALQSPLLQIEGKGTIDLPRRSLDLRLTPKFVAPVVGQLGLGSRGVAVPVIVRGPWNSPLYLPDLAGMVRGGLEVPVDVLKGVVELPGSLLGGRKQAPAPDGAPPEKKNPLLRGLFGR